SEEHYGTSPVWSNYRRNQKGGIPPQKTRNTCINVKLLQHFRSPYTGVVYDPTRTGLLPFQVPHVDFSGEDYSNSHDAVGSAPLPPTMTPWYRWYHTIQPDETEVSIGGVPVDVFQGLPSNSVPLLAHPWEQFPNHVHLYKQ
uniref:Uncharacterized protein n=1 Tax=Oncorhynchus kisutch TaxID=8019 RepID=A0A8C7G0G4_ONCKI